MKILAFEFSSPQRSVAVVVGAHLNSATVPPPHPGPLPLGGGEGGSQFAPARAADHPLPRRGGEGRGEGAPSSFSEVIQTGGWAANALGMAEQALREARLERHQIECLAIGIGPGSYNGIRTTIAVAQGWQLARPVRLLGISSADCLAAQARTEGLIGPICVVIDAQRGEFYLAGYEISQGGWRETAPLRLASLQEAESCAETGQVIIGPEVTNWFPEGRILFPRAATLGRLALNRIDFISGEKLEPIYLRETKFVKAPLPRILPEAY